MTYKKSRCHVDGSVDMMKWCLWFILIFVEAGEMVHLKTPAWSFATPIRRTSPGGRNYTAFEGIRYKWRVETSKFRFVPINSEPRSWLQSLNRRINCMHVDPTSGEIFGRKDCTFLNIYTPSYRRNVSMPVLIWIHGTQLSLGTTRSSKYDPSRFMDHDIVFVTMTYRLDVLGFVRSYFAKLFGNYGLDDQRVAIEWVTKNIKSFGGDPGRITLAGHGAGASHALFHLKRNNWTPGGHAIKRGIAISGTRFAPWAKATFAFLTYSKYQAMLLKSENVEEECLETIKPACLEKIRFSTLVNTSRTMMLESANLWDTMLWPFKPVQESIYIHQEPGREFPFVNSNFTLLLGLNRNEGDIISAFARERNWTGNWKDTMFRTYFDFDYYLSRKNLWYIKGQMNDMYEMTSSRDKRVSNMMSDGWFFLPAIREALYHDGPFQGFMFDFKSELGLMNCRVPRSGEGTSHGDELPYIFTIKGCLVDPKNEWVAKKYVNMLARFVIDGDTQLKKYPEDQVLFNITEQLDDPEEFSKIDENLMIRLTIWRQFY
ncbi:esterase E4-like [Cimex lectularius]|uniref:Carboxylesterase type B domain-containing protein n=1 Tax=Cimex lectularius TaxID=79782 RepID=A0A8I6S2H0_CIMLE|nr:esterase E4-like [Cimex lectularius]